MLAELTYRCPLSCPYCSNPVEMAKKESELDTEVWLDVFDQAAKLGVLQLHLSGGSQHRGVILWPWSRVRVRRGFTPT